MDKIKTDYKFISIKERDLKNVSNFLKDLGDQNAIHLNPALKFLKWKYQYNYFAKNTAFLKAIKTKNKIVGICGYLPFKLVTPLGIKKSIWGMDILFDKEAIKHPFVMLQAWNNEAKNLQKSGVSHSLTFPSTKVLFENWQKLGFISVDFYSFECRLGRKVDGGRPVDIFVKSLKKFNEKVDILFARISKQYDFIAVKSSEYLNWRYKDHPYNRYKIFGAFDKQNKMQAYIIARKDSRDDCGYILDILGDLESPQYSYAVILKALAYFKKQSCYKVQIALSHREYMQIFKKFGFYPFRKEFCLYLNDLKSFKKTVYKNKKWHITMGDGDFRGGK